MKLFYIILGCTPNGRNTEQHDVFFGIAENIENLISDINNFWKEANGKIHIDFYKIVQFVDGYEVKVVKKTNKKNDKKLFFINLGGYKEGVLNELHEQFLMVGSDCSEVIKKVKQTEFYKKMNVANSTTAISHIDDKHGVDIDDIHNINDILPEQMKQKYSLIIEKSEEKNQKNFTKLGYLNLEKIK